MDLELSKKAVLVTGGSRGIGLAIASTFAHEGARVAMVARGEDALFEAEAKLKSEGLDVSALAVDVATEEGARRAVVWAQATLGRLDILVNNVGGSLGSGMFDSTSAADWTRVLDLNLMSAVWCSQAAVTSMKEDAGGVIIHVSSICGLEYCSSAAYTAAKGAVAALTNEMGRDLAKFKIRVVAVAPGSVMFPGGSWDRRRLANPEMVSKMLQDELPWARFGTPEEIADVVVFAASGRASWVTGTTLIVDGGQSRRQ